MKLFLLQFLSIFFQLFELLIFLRIILSWLRVPVPFRVRQFLLDVTEPYLGLFRRIIPPVGMIDFSPLVAIIVLELVAQVILTAIAG